jgi:hypothetical protein
MATTVVEYRQYSILGGGRQSPVISYAQITTIPMEMHIQFIRYHPVSLLSSVLTGCSENLSMLNE